MIKDYDCMIDYYLGKASAMADALSCKSIARLKLTPLQIVHDLRTMHAQLLFDTDGCIQANLQVKPLLTKQIKEAAQNDRGYARLVEKVKQGEKPGFTISHDGMLMFQGQMCVPDNIELK